MASAYTLEDVTRKLSEPRGHRDTIIIASGINDLKHDSVDKVKDKLDSVTQMGKASYPRAVLYLVSLLPYPNLEREIEEVNYYMRDLAQRNKDIVFINTCSSFSRSYMQQDNIHPNIDGLKHIEQCIRNSVVRKMAKPQGRLEPKPQRSQFQRSTSAVNYANVVQQAPPSTGTPGDTRSQIMPPSQGNTQQPNSIPSCPPAPRAPPNQALPPTGPNQANYSPTYQPNNVPTACAWSNISTSLPSQIEVVTSGETDSRCNFPIYDQHTQNHNNTWQQQYPGHTHHQFQGYQVPHWPMPQWGLCS